MPNLVPSYLGQAPCCQTFYLPPEVCFSLFFHNHNHYAPYCLFEPSSDRWTCQQCTQVGPLYGFIECWVLTIDIQRNRPLIDPDCSALFTALVMSPTTIKSTLALHTEPVYRSSPAYSAMACMQQPVHQLWPMISLFLVFTCRSKQNKSFFKTLSGSSIGSFEMLAGLNFN